MDVPDGRLLSSNVMQQECPVSIKCSVFVAASVDGFIATQDGGLDWLERPEFSATPMKGLSYAEFISSVDCLVMGRKTFEKVMSFEKWPYEGTPVVVLSRSQTQVPAGLEGKVEFRSGSPHEIIDCLQNDKRNHLYIDGGVTIQKFLEANLIHEITITRIPVLLGKGIPLFCASGTSHVLKLVGAAISESGIVQERYAVEGVA